MENPTKNPIVEFLFMKPKVPQSCQLLINISTFSPGGVDAPEVNRDACGFLYELHDVLHLCSQPGYLACVRVLNSGAFTTYNTTVGVTRNLTVG